jgi:DNA polymerase-3 subunit epsilon
MKKILWIDTETTGTDPTLHSMIEISGIIDIDGKIEDQFSFHSKPHPDFLIDDDALKINKITTEQMQQFPEMDHTRKALTRAFGAHIDKFNKEDKFTIAGQNVKFDIDFLSHFFFRQKDFYLGSYVDFRKRIELYELTNAMRMLGFIKSDKLSLGNLCKEFGIELKAHNSLSDITATRTLYYEIIGNLKWKRK